MAIVNDVATFAASLNLSLSPDCARSAEGVHAPRDLARELRRTGPHRRAARSGPPLAMDTGWWCRESAVMRQLRLTEANLLAIVLHSEKSRFQVAALIQEGRPVRPWTIRATNGHSIEWPGRNRLSWDIPRELASQVPCCVHLSEWCSSLSISVQGLLHGGWAEESQPS